MHLFTLLGIALAIGSAAGIPTPGPHVLHERRETPLQYWEKRSRACPDAKLSVRIGLTQRNLHLGPQHLKEISDPTSPSYGKHWTAKQIVDFFAPSDDSIQSVRAWLENAGIVEDRQALTTKRGWIWFEANVAEVEALLNTEYYLFQHGETGENQIGCNEYSIPAAVRPHIDFVTPTIGFSKRDHKIVREPVDRDSHRKFSKDSASNQVVLGAGISQDPILDTSMDPGVSFASCGNAMTPACITGIFLSKPLPSLDHL